MSFAFNPPVPPDTKLQWLVSYEDHTAYVWMMDQIKRRQLAKGGARLAQHTECDLALTVAFSSKVVAGSREEKAILFHKRRFSRNRYSR
jgi:hypothetical protein